MELRRVVTGVTDAGRSAIVENEPAPETSVAALPGVSFYRIWSTELAASQPRQDEPSTPYWPGPSGTRCVAIRFTPQADGDGPPAPSEAGQAEIERALPGMTEVFEPASPGFHTSRTIDYAVCLAGEMVLVVDDEDELQVTPGMCTVQLGTRHAWEHRSDRDAVMLFVLIGAPDATEL